MGITIIVSENEENLANNKLVNHISCFRSKNHYGDLFEKSKYDREFLRKKQVKQMETAESNRQEIFLYVMIGIGGLFVFLIAQGTTDYDLDKTTQKHQHTNTSTGLEK